MSAIVVPHDPAWAERFAQEAARLATGPGTELVRSAERTSSVPGRRAAEHSVAAVGTETLVICAEPDYHALGLSESLGFERRERTADAHLMPPEDRAPA